MNARSEPARTSAHAPDAAGQALRAVGLGKHFPAAHGRGDTLEIFHDLDLEVAPGEMVAIVGRSGSGKSSLLHLLAGLDRPTAGEIYVMGEPLHTLRAEALAELRGRKIGFLWQFHHLLPEFNAEENAAMPLLAQGVPRAQAAQRAREWLQRVGLGQRARHRPGELSGGEQQRVALARALVTQPAIMLADEPTGDLDDETALDLFSLLERFCAAQGLAVVLVTHNRDIAARCSRVLGLAQGRLEPLERGRPRP